MDALDELLGPPVDLEDESDSSDNSSRKRHKSKLPLAKPLCAGTDRSGFQKTCRTCLEHIREAMLHHRWQEAAEYMTSYTQVLEDRNKGRALPNKELIWRISTEILHHLSHSTVKDYNIIYERMKHSGVKHYLMICLEHSFHLMLHGQIEGAKQQLSVAESWRYGKVSSSQHQRHKLIQAYRSLLDYMIWCDKRSTLSKNNFVFESDNQAMHTYFRHASVNLQEILKNPGVWDPFILCYVEMLEFYGDNEEALNVLNDYAYDNSFPRIPTRQVYVYQFLKRHNAPKKKLMKVLRNLQILVPSHELMLEYSCLLLQSEKASDTERALGVLLEMLDFACWRSDLDVWTCLKAVIHQLLLREDGEMTVCKHMALRMDWWPALHFTSFHAKKDREENGTLLEVKVSLAEILCPGRALKYTAEQMPT